MFGMSYSLCFEGGGLPTWNAEYSALDHFSVRLLQPLTLFSVPRGPRTITSRLEPWFALGIAILETE